MIETLGHWHLWLTAATIVAVLGALSTTRAPADVVFVGAVTVLVVAGVLTPAQAFGGLANEGVLTVAVLYVVAAAVKETGGVQWIVQHVLGHPKSILHAQLRLMLPVTAFSAFLNNTPVVATLIPAVSEWARRFELPPSKLFIPLSYAAILGGTCTLIGTSTNLVVNGMLIASTGQGLSMFDMLPIGLPVALLGIVLVLVCSRRLLPNRQAVTAQLESVREYTIEMTLDEKSPLAGRTIEQAGLRHLPGCYLMEIERDGEALPGVGPTQNLHAGDRLIFVGQVDSVVDLQKIRGLTPATDQVFKLSRPRSQRTLVEAVVSDVSPMANRSIREGEFRTRYDAVVLAVARNGERIRGKIGDIRLRAGDTLLLEAGESFLSSQRYSRDFFLTRHIEGSNSPRHEKARMVLFILAGMVTVAGLGLLSMLHAALVAAGLLVGTRCLSVHAARSSVDWSVILVIAAAFGLSAALNESGLASMLAHAITGLSGTGTSGVLVSVFIATALLSAIMTNNAAAALMFPIAEGLAEDSGVGLVSVAVTIMFGASASFATPMGYQTNLMVYGPGGYRFKDYLGIGLVMTTVVGLVAVPLLQVFF